jgi:hypothetical protein
MRYNGKFLCDCNPISPKTLRTIHKTMIDNNVPYIIALGMVKGVKGITKKEFNKLTEGFSDDTIKGAAMMGRFSSL